MIALALGATAAYAKQAIRDKLIEHKQYIHRWGEDMPEILNWTWDAAAAPRARRAASVVRGRRQKSTEADNV